MIHELSTYLPTYIDRSRETPCVKGNVMHAATMNTGHYGRKQIITFGPRRTDIQKR